MTAMTRAQLDRQRNGRDPITGKYTAYRAPEPLGGTGALQSDTSDGHTAASSVEGTAAWALAGTGLVGEVTGDGVGEAVYHSPSGQTVDVRREDEHGTRFSIPDPDRPHLRQHCALDKLSSAITRSVRNRARLEVLDEHAPALGTPYTHAERTERGWSAHSPDGQAFIDVATDGDELCATLDTAWSRHPDSRVNSIANRHDQMGTYRLAAVQEARQLHEDGELTDAQLAVVDRLASTKRTVFPPAIDPVRRDGVAYVDVDVEITGSAHDYRHAGRSVSAVTARINPDGELASVSFAPAGADRAPQLPPESAGAGHPAYEKVAFLLKAGGRTG